MNSCEGGWVDLTSRSIIEKVRQCDRIFSLQSIMLKQSSKS